MSTCQCHPDNNQTDRGSQLVVNVPVLLVLEPRLLELVLYLDSTTTVLVKSSGEFSQSRQNELLFSSVLLLVLLLVPTFVQT